MKKIIAILLCIVALFVSVSCSSEPVVGTPVGSNASVLDGKKIIFIGNSFTYYGNCVMERSVTNYSQEQRSNDQGYFYQLCKANGANVCVTNWTYGGHALSDSLGVCGTDKSCSGHDHLADLVDRNFDYVVLQNGSRSSDLTTLEFVEQIKGYMKLFTDVNPDTKFVFLVQSLAHFDNYTWKPAIKELEKEGLVIADWGKLVVDIVNKAVFVPGATQQYNKNSFIISKSATDGYHPNMLTGYLTALYTYCAITGETAVGQDYSFCTDPFINFDFDAQDFIANEYTYKGATTNMIEIFNSSSDMRGLQTLVNRYMSNKAYLNY